MLPMLPQGPQPVVGHSHVCVQFIGQPLDSGLPTVQLFTSARGLGPLGGQLLEPATQLLDPGGNHGQPPS